MKPKTVGRVTGGENRRTSSAQTLCHGLPVGLPIMTADGVLPVEHLSAGDLIITRNGGMTRLDAITASTHSTRAVVFEARSFNASGPDRDVLLPAEQPVLVRDWRAQAMFGQGQAMTSAAQLVNGETIRDIGPRKLVLFRLEFDRPRVIFAGGLELGSTGDIALPQRAAA